jgi:hypothetical protein
VAKIRLLRHFLVHFQFKKGSRNMEEKLGILIRTGTQNIASI